MMVLVIHNKSNVQGNRIPEYRIYLSKAVVVLISLLFICGVIIEIINFFS
jgi:hypothetical protein